MVVQDEVSSAETDLISQNHQRTSRGFNCSGCFSLDRSANTGGMSLDRFSLRRKLLKITRIPQGELLTDSDWFSLDGSANTGGISLDRFAPGVFLLIFYRFATFFFNTLHFPR